jgi:hypothetical protein
MGNIDSRPVRYARKIHNHQPWDSNIAHRTSDFEFFSKLLNGGLHGNPFGAA